MERELWPILYRALGAVSADQHQNKVRYQPWVIVATLLWAALHDRPRGWACQSEHWDTTPLRPDRVPSPSTVSRRARRPEVTNLLDRLTAQLRGTGTPAWTLMIDGKPLPVGRCSKDPDAHSNQHGKGYKLHMIWGARCVPEAWEVTAANAYEGAVAERLLESVRGKGVLLGDGGYEANRVYDVAAASGYLLLAAVGAEDTGGGHGYQSEHRQLALRWMRDGLGWHLLGARPVIERAFGHMGSFGGGLGPLPNWVRKLARVARWVHCKLLINAARLIYRRQQKMAQMQ
jgi:hypothetical protein